ncbi:hypothetical protein MASR2M78_09720 [Treponema sp.]
MALRDEEIAFDLGVSEDRIAGEEEMKEQGLAGRQGDLGHGEVREPLNE